MAETEAPAKQVQEIATNCDSPPGRYIYEDDGYGGVDSPALTAQIPVIDIGLLSVTDEEEEINKLRSALSSWGCFQAINHGIEASFLETVREIGKQFFALGMEEKKKYMRRVDDIEGYGNDMVLSQYQTLDWTDRLYLTVLPQSGRKLEFWPEKPLHFRETLDEYGSKLQVMAETLLKAMARSVNLDENSFWIQYGSEKATMTARFNLYPLCPWPDKILGVKPHGDGSAITVLLQDEQVEGLQILKDGCWFKVPIIPNALTINVGDQIEIMSNGVFKSPVHRVMTNAEKERTTLAMFCMPQTETDIRPVEELITEENPRLYKNVTFSHDFFFQNYQQGKRPIDAAKV